MPGVERRESVSGIWKTLLFIWSLSWVNLRKRRDPEKEHPSWVCWGKCGTCLVCYSGMELLLAFSASGPQKWHNLQTKKLMILPRMTIMSLLGNRSHPPHPSHKYNNHPSTVDVCVWLTQNITECLQLKQKIHIRDNSALTALWKHLEEACHRPLLWMTESPEREKTWPKALN